MRQNVVDLTFHGNVSLSRYQIAGLPYVGSIVFSNPYLCSRQAGTGRHDVRPKVGEALTR